MQRPVGRTQMSVSDIFAKIGDLIPSLRSHFQTRSPDANARISREMQRTPIIEEVVDEAVDVHHQVVPYDPAVPHEVTRSWMETETLRDVSFCTDGIAANARHIAAIGAENAVADRIAENEAQNLELLRRGLTAVSDNQASGSSILWSTASVFGNLSLAFGGEFGQMIYGVISGAQSLYAAATNKDNTQAARSALSALRGGLMSLRTLLRKEHVSAVANRGAAESEYKKIKEMVHTELLRLQQQAIAIRTAPEGVHHVHGIYWYVVTRQPSQIGLLSPKVSRSSRVSEGGVSVEVPEEREVILAAIFLGKSVEYHPDDPAHRLRRPEAIDRAHSAYLRMMCVVTMDSDSGYVKGVTRMIDDSHDEYHSAVCEAVRAEFGSETTEVKGTGHSPLLYPDLYVRDCVSMLLESGKVRGRTRRERRVRFAAAMTGGPQ